jgi:4-aminobutyrate aminotransferase and related aminotransferases
MLEGVSFFPYPYLYRSSQENALSFEAYTTALEESNLFTTDVAAAIIEPVLGEGGYVPAPAAFLEALEKICKSKGILLIIDEIQSGIGRTGKWFAFQHTCIQPDIIVTAKGLGSGMPIGACLAKTKIMNQWPPGAHGGTYGGNPVACAATVATLDIVEKVQQNVPFLSQLASNLLHEGLRDHPNIGDIRVFGLMIGIECVKDKVTKEPLPDLITFTLNESLKRHLIVLSCGIHYNVIRLAPPLIISEKELRSGLATLIEVLHDYY